MKQKKKSRKGLAYTEGVNITPLLDVLTVMLFFLIKSMSVTTVNITPKDQIRLPASQIEGNAEEAMLVTLSANELTLDHEVFYAIEKGRFPASEIATDGRTLKKLHDALEKKFQKRLAVYQAAPDFDPASLPAPKLLIQADKELPFGLMKYMLHTVAKAGYTDYQFVTIPEEE
jgi:biopolymer transport protein ExbD